MVGWPLGFVRMVVCGAEYGQATAGIGGGRADPPRAGRWPRPHQATPPSVPTVAACPCPVAKPVSPPPHARSVPTPASNKHKQLLTPASSWVHSTSWWRRCSPPPNPTRTASTGLNSAGGRSGSPTTTRCYPSSDNSNRPGRGHGAARPGPSSCRRRGTGCTGFTSQVAAPGRRSPGRTRSPSGPSSSPATTSWCPRPSGTPAKPRSAASDPTTPDSSKPSATTCSTTTGASSSCMCGAGRGSSSSAPRNPTASEA